MGVFFMEKKLRRFYYGLLLFILCAIGLQGADLAQSRAEKKLLPTGARPAVPSVTNKEKKLVYASGEPVGIYIKTKGVLVLGIQEPSPEEGKSGAPSAHILKSGDYILKMNGKEITSKKQLLSLIQKNGEKDIIFTILRGEEQQDVRIKPVYYPETDQYRIDAWIRNDTQGIGTLTYLTENGSFAALGHGINDCDLGVRMDIAEGSVYKTDISSIMKGKIKSPGEIIGTIDYVPENYLGSISKNTVCGIFGILEQKEQLCKAQKPLPVAEKEEIKKGKAFLRTSISGESRDYTMEIEKISINKKDPQKAMKIKVTDPELIRLTGGIIQGLSGSPIIQDGKLVGAVTHVFVDSPLLGYGICAETMMEEMNSR